MYSVRLNKMIKKNHLLIALFLGLAIVTYAKDKRDKLIAPQVAVFYPHDFDSVANMPSFALLKEFPSIGKVSNIWKLKPVFYSQGKKSCAAIPVKKGTSLYATGEVIGSLLRNNTDITLWNSDNYTYSKDDGKRLYQSHPWVLGVNEDGTAFGVIADNTWKQQLILSDSIKFISEGPAFRMIVIQRNSPQEVLVALGNLIGRIEMPPLWGLGYQQCRYSYEPDTRAKQIADEFRNRNIPCDVIWFDIDYMDKYKIFTFDKTKFADPKELNNYLHGKGFKSIWMIDPGVKVEKGYSVYDSGSQGDHWVKTKDGKDFVGKVWPGDCSFPDFTQPKTQQWWGSLYKDYMATGIDGVWNDMNEPSVFDGPDGTMPEDNMHRGGGVLPADKHLRYHNVYGDLMIRSSREGIMKANSGKRPFILSRSGYLGSHRYGATWTGDNKASMEHLKMSIPMVLNLGLSGQPFSGPDISGFAGNTDAELYGQWIALGAFYPFSRGHAEKGANDKEPWSFGSKIEKVAQTALNRRYRLLPYFYTLFNEASVTGLPIMRPMFFADVKDTTLRREDQSFLLGNDLMIVPKWASNPVMPKGNWQTISIVGEDSSKDKYQPNVLIREGAIVPLGNIIQSTTSYSVDSLTLVISTNAKGTASGKLYNDAGEGYEYKEGKYAVWQFNAMTNGNVVTVKANKTAGLLIEKPKTIKLVLYTASGMTESEWQTGGVYKIKLNNKSNNHAVSNLNILK